MWSWRRAAMKGWVERSCPPREASLWAAIRPLPSTRNASPRLPMWKAVSELRILSIEIGEAEGMRGGRKGLDLLEHEVLDRVGEILRQTEVGLVNLIGGDGPGKCDRVHTGKAQRDAGNGHHEENQLGG